MPARDVSTVREKAEVVREAQAQAHKSSQDPGSIRDVEELLKLATLRVVSTIAIVERKSCASRRQRQRRFPMQSLNLEEILQEHKVTVQSWECLYFHRKAKIFFSVYVDHINMGGRK